MFGAEEGARPNSSSSRNVRTMQLFHELKQQFPTVPDHVVTACIAAGEAKACGHTRRLVLPEAEALLRSHRLQQQDFTTSVIAATAGNKSAESGHSIKRTSFSERISSPENMNFPERINLPEKTSLRLEKTNPLEMINIQERINFPDRINHLEKSNFSERINHPERINFPEIINPSEKINLPEKTNPAESIHFRQRTYLPKIVNTAGCINLDESANPTVQCNTPSERIIPEKSETPSETTLPSDRLHSLSQKRTTSESFHPSETSNSPTNTPPLQRNNPIQTSINPIDTPLSPPPQTLTTPPQHPQPQVTPPQRPERETTTPPPQRPQTLNISAAQPQRSPKFHDLPKHLADKPPKSPTTNRLNNPIAAVRPIPEEQTNYCDGEPKSDSAPSETNVKSGKVERHSAEILMVPQPSWLLNQQPHNASTDKLLSPSQRSFTSVNLTLRAPTSEPQPPIDITSKNSTLTYSTSTFDSQKGLQSRLQITVSPTGGSVSSYRTRPRSFHLDDENGPGVGVVTTTTCRNNMLHKGVSLQDLGISAHDVLAKQRARIEKLRIEVATERGKLVAVQQEVVRLKEEGTQVVDSSYPVDVELEKQLQMEIQHLRTQCESLSRQVDHQSDNSVPVAQTREDFYENLYTGQRGPSDFGRLAAEGTTSSSYWTCPKCTFQNHPLIKQCEQCDMVHIVHGTTLSASTTLDAARLAAK